MFLDEQKNLSLVFLDRADQLIDRVESTWYAAMYKKGYLSKIDSLCTYCTTGEIASSQVVYGKDHWLFYKSSTDGDSIGDFEGTNRFTDTEMNDILNDVLWTQEQLEERGITFALMVAPSKENVYVEFMPDIYTHEEISSTDLLIDLWGDQDACIARNVF